ncbi:hypothetical protein GCM10010277_76300 [Streptomyces longisporoflavus]|nr:hypothetical protein GCM10010277_76300 [Streptomyces longisporoflavus]
MIALVRLGRDTARAAGRDRKAASRRCSGPATDLRTHICSPRSSNSSWLPARNDNFRYARTGFQTGHFAQLGTQVPHLLVDATLAARLCEAEARLQAYRQPAGALELTETAAIRWGGSERQHERAPGVRASPRPPRLREAGHGRLKAYAG